MYASMKGTWIEAVVYLGPDGDVYPRWFQELLQSSYDDADYRSNQIIRITDDSEHYLNQFVRLSDETDDDFKVAVLIPKKTVVLRNKHGDIYYTTFATFKDLYLPMGPHLAALKEDCVEYRIYKDEWKSNVRGDASGPEWYKELAEEGSIDILMYGEGLTVYHSDGGDYGLTRNDVFVRNNLGEIRYMTKNDFERHFDVPNSYPF